MKTTTRAALATALIALGAAWAPLAAHACEGRVYGLSGRYDLAKGSGFLAIRARPTTRSRMVGQTFNGNQVEIRRRSGRWLFVYDFGSGKRGWVYDRYVDSYC